MLQAEVLVLELVAVDGLATSSVVVGEVTTLAHETGDNPVEGGSLVAESLLASAQGTEVLGSLRINIKIKNKETNEYMGKADVNRIFPMDILSNHYIDFCRLRPKIGDIPGEQIKLTCEFSIANAGVSSMFNVVSKCAYGNTIDADAHCCIF